MVRAAAPYLGIAADRVVAMTPAVGDDGALLPGSRARSCTAKASRRAEHARPDARSALLGAFGDSTYDAAMLGAARVPVAVTPAPGLVALAPTIPGLVTLAR